MSDKISLSTVASFCAHTTEMLENVADRARFVRLPLGQERRAALRLTARRGAKKRLSDSLSAVRAANSSPAGNVRYWPLADIGVCTAHVRFQG